MGIRRSSVQRAAAVFALEEQLVNPRSLRASTLSDGERALRDANAVLTTGQECGKVMGVGALVTTGLDSWGQHALRAVGAKGAGSGDNGAWTKADVEALIT